MSITTNKTEIEGDRVRLDIVVSEDQVARERARTLQRLAREIRVPGFRPGKVPAEVVVQRVGADVANDELLKDALGGWYHTALHDADVDPIADPDISLNAVPDEGDLIFSATVQLKPMPTLGEYTGLEVARDPAEIPDGAVDTEIERLRAAAARLQPVERPAAAGDFVSIDFEGRRGGKRMRDAAARDYVVELGANRLVEGFDTHLIGLSAGETTGFTIAYSKGDQRTQLRGSKIDYTVTMRRVFELHPEESDGFVREVSEFETLDQLREEVEQTYRTQVEEAVEEMFRRRVIDAAVSNAEVEVPAGMLQARIEDMLRDGQSRLPEGVTLEQYVTARGQSMEQLVREMAPEASAAIKRELVVEAVVDAEGVQVSDAEVDEQIRGDAEASGRDPDELTAEVNAIAHGRDRLRHDLALKKAVDLMVESAVAIAPEAAEARERLWTPEDEKREAGELWTPGSGPANPTPGES